MKIYIKNNGTDINTVNTKNNHKKKTTSSAIPKKTRYQMIYSEEGIFRIQNNRIFKLIPQDIAAECFNYNNIEFIIDKSSYTFRKDIYSIPYKHIFYDIEQFEYKLQNSDISLIVDYNKNKILDIYFYTKNEKYPNFENIIEYISLFNDIKQS